MDYDFEQGSSIARARSSDCSSGGLLGIANASDLLRASLNSEDVSVREALVAHGLPELSPNCPTTRKRQLFAHILKGDCYSETSAHAACLRQRLLQPECLTNLRSLFVSLLSNSTPEAQPFYLEICLSLHLVSSNNAADLSLSTLSRVIESYVSRVLVSNEDFSVLSDIETLTLSELYPILALHEVQLPNIPLSLEQMKGLLLQHLCSHNCRTMSSTKDRPSCRMAADVVLRKLHILEMALQRKVKLRPLRRLIRSMELPIPEYDELSLHKLRSSVKKHIREVNKAIQPQLSLVEEHVAEINATVEERIRNWPQLCPREVKEQFQSAFLDATSPATLREKSCVVCSGSFRGKDMFPERIRLSELMSLPLLRIGQSVPNLLSNLYARDDELDGLAINSDAVFFENSVAEMECCKTCHRHLVKNGKLPPLALANDLLLGKVPQELSDLTVVEESLIARRRAKMWVVQLKGDSESGEEGDSYTFTNSTSITSSSAVAQRGLRGHVVVYPADPQNLATTLPPSLEDASTLVCVVFVGSSPPTKEWLLQKAKPLITGAG